MEEGRTESKSERERGTASRGTSGTETAGATRCARERTRDCLGMSARVPTPVALAPGFGTPSCPPSLHPGNRSPFALLPRPLSYGGASDAIVLVARSRGAPSVTWGPLTIARLLLPPLTNTLFLSFSFSFFVLLRGLFTVSLFLLPAVLPLPSRSLVLHSSRCVSRSLSISA